MPDKTLIILTHHFPCRPGEEFLKAELNVTSLYFKKIILCPLNVMNGEKSLHILPSNVEVIITKNIPNHVGILSLFGIIINILRKELFVIPNKKLFFMMLKFNLSLLRQCYRKAKQIENYLMNPKQTIIYSFWCDDLALTGAFIKSRYPENLFISRAHGFDVFEEQSDIKYIFFRSFQLSKLDRLWSVSESGSNHLKSKNPVYNYKIGCRYLGIDSDGKISYRHSDVITLVTCSHVRSIKRLHILIEALKLISNIEVEWHVIGDGPDLESLKELSTELHNNCKVIFHGHLSTSQIHEFYGNNHFDFLVSLSSSEGLPVSMMEAISHGIPILSTDVGGCREIVNEVTGELIPADFLPNLLTLKIAGCKQSKYNNLVHRQAIRSFWQDNFDSKVNYKKFAEDILELKRD